uniref:Putative DNA binding, helix-turn-helix domain containing protein n=1 Tax=viral metagenome TaxID=1070528 RepID=A0A6M3LIA7_9ZZZZ
MLCPKCGNKKNKLYRNNLIEPNNIRKRHRTCLKCGNTYITYEVTPDKLAANVLANLNQTPLKKCIMENTNYPTFRDMIDDCYNNLYPSLSKTGQHLGVSYQTVKNWLVECNIKPHPKGGYNRVGLDPNSRKAQVCKLDPDKLANMTAEQVARKFGISVPYFYGIASDNNLIYKKIYSKKNRVD